MTLGEKQRIFSRNVAKLIERIFESGHSCSLGEVYRTEEQAKLYVLSGKGILDSLHCKKLAIDIHLFSPEGVYLTDSQEYKVFGEYWTTLHPFNRWGGIFKRADGNHFEMQDI